jgi:hypothetical protein
MKTTQLTSVKLVNLLYDSCNYFDNVRQSGPPPGKLEMVCGAMCCIPSPNLSFPSKNAKWDIAKLLSRRGEKVGLPYPFIPSLSSC